MAGTVQQLRALTGRAAPTLTVRAPPDSITD
jgi:hypothetical protein